MISIRHHGLGSRTEAHVRRVEWLAWGAAAVLFGAHAWLYRYEMVNLDGISYLELAWAWREGRWSDAINGYWSPMYPWLLALFLGIVRPAPAAEYPTVHAANATAGLLALAAFVYFARALLPATVAVEGRMPAAVRAAAAYALFIWSSIVMLVVWMESPDMLLATFIFLTAGALTRVAHGDVRFRTFALFGAGVGLGYLTKSAMLLIGALFFVSLAAAALPRRAWLGLLLAGAVSAALAAPWILTLSIAKAKLTFAETGRINYIWFVNASENWPHNFPLHWPHWSGDPANGTPVRPARRLNADPAVYEFAHPVPGTYPMWHDVSYWYEGVAPYFDPADQLRRLKISADDLYEVFALSPYNVRFFNPQPALLCLLLMAAASLRGSGAARALAASWPCWMPPLGAIGMYAVVYVEPRYIGAFVVLLWVFAVDALRHAPGSEPGRRLLTACGALMCAVLCAAALAATWIEAYPAVRRLIRGEADREHVAWRTAERMHQAGLRPGENIAVAGNAQVATRWTHLARARIIAEVPWADHRKLWTDAAARETVVRAFAGAGATWAVLEQPADETVPGWRRVEGTPYLLRRLQ